MARIGLDADGVLFDYSGILRRFILDNSDYTEEELPPVVDWRFYETWGKDAGWYQYWNERFVNDKGFTRAEIIGGHETAEVLSDVPPEHQLVLITARTSGVRDRDAVEEQTFWWLDHVLGFRFDEVHFTKDKCSVPVDFYLDDKIENWQAFNNQPGTASFLMAQPWNREYEKTPRRVNSVKEYLEAVYAIVAGDRLCDSDLPAPKEALKDQEWADRAQSLVNNTSLQGLTIGDFPIPEAYPPFGSDPISITIPAAEKDPWKNERDDLLDRFLFELSKATGDGSKKRQAGEKPPWYLDDGHEGAIFSHITKWKRGEKVDPDSGAHPLVHAAWRCLAIACKESGNTPDPMLQSREDD